MADAAIIPNRDDYERVLTSNLDRRIVQVEGGNAEKAVPLRDVKLTPSQAETFKWQDYVFYLDQGAIRKTPAGTQYQWALPKISRGIYQPRSLRPTSSCGK